MNKLNTLFNTKSYVTTCVILLCAIGLYAQTPPEDLFPIKIGSSYGYINRAGKRIIRAQYDSASFFYEGVAAVKYGRKWGYINNLDSFIVSPIFTKACDFHEGAAAVKYKSPEGDTTIDFCGYIKPNGQYLIPLSPFISTTHNYSNGRVLIQDQQKEWFYYLADKNGKMVHKFDGVHIPEPDTIEFSENKMRIIVGSRRGYIDTLGNNLFVTDYMEMGSFHEGLAWTMDGNLHGFIDTLAHDVIKPQEWDWVSDFHEGLCTVKKGMTFSDEFLKLMGGKAGFIDHSGKVVIDFQYDDAGNFCEGLARVKINGKWGFIDKTGKMVIPAIYDQAGDFFRGMAPVILAKENGYINHRAKFIGPKVKP